MKSILVVGGAGYIGSHVVLAFLNAGYRVTVLDNMSTGQQINLIKEAEFILGDILDRELLKDLFTTKFDGVIHLAALKAAGESMIYPEKYTYQNINGTMNLLEAVSLSGTRTVIFSSTAAVYGVPEYLPLDENHPINPINYYGFTKHEIERFLEWYHRLKNIQTASLRYFNAAGYDPDGRILGLEKGPENLIPKVMETLVGLQDLFEVYGDDYSTPDGTCIRDYIHVSDLANAHLKAFEYLTREENSIALNFGTGRGYSVMDVIKMTESVSGRKLNYKIGSRRLGDPGELYADASQAEELLGWVPQLSDLESIIQTTWDVYRELAS